MNIIFFIKDQLLKILSVIKTDKEILNRLKFGILVIVPTYITIYIGDYFYCIYILILTSLILIEFLKIIENIKEKNINFYDFYKKYGIVYILIGTVCLILLRFLDQGYKITFWLFTTTWSFDVLCYVFGKKYGKTKLTSISPGKTLEGFIFGSIFSILISMLILRIFKTDFGLNYDKFLIFNIAFVVCIQYADILESYIKRICDVKDSGTLLGKHGGFMDRFDGIYGGAILLYVVSFFCSGRIF